MNWFPWIWGVMCLAWALWVGLRHWSVIEEESRKGYQRGLDQGRREVREEWERTARGAGNFGGDN